MPEAEAAGCQRVELALSRATMQSQRRGRPASILAVGRPAIQVASVPLPVAKPEPGPGGLRVSMTRPGLGPGRSQVAGAAAALLPTQ